MDQKLDDLKKTDRDPSDVQKALEQKASEEEKRPPQQTSDPSAGSSSRVSEHEPKKKKERKASSFLDTDPEDSEIERKGRWRPSLRRDKATNLPVLRPREVTQEEKRGITRSPSPDTRDGHYSKVHFRTNTGWRDISLWVDTEMLVQLREKDPDTLRGALRDRMGLTREMIIEPSAAIRQREMEETGDVPRERTARKYLSDEVGTRFMESLPIVRPDDMSMEALASQSLHSKSVIATGLTSELMKKAARTFLSSETSERLQERRRQNLNSSSYQLSVLAANFGNLSRPSRINKKAITIDAPSVLAQFLTKTLRM